jgi:hypothetical protein
METEMNAKTAKALVTTACREVFPRILPSRLQDARHAILSHLDMVVEDFGAFPSGGNKFDNICSQVVKDLKSTGEMRTQGWTWHWVGQPVEMVTGFDLFDVVDVTEPVSLYNLNDEDTLIRLVAVTPCFGKVMKSDTMCQGCPLLDICCEKKGELSKTKKQIKEAKHEALDVAFQAGYDLKKVKIPSDARINEAKTVTCQSPTSCIVSGEVIDRGEVAVHIPSWGMVKEVIAKSYQAMLNT